MKKLLIMAVIATAAIVSQGAACAWSLTGITASPDNAAAAGWVAYFMDGSTYTALSALSADKVGAYAAENYTYSATTASGRTGVGVTATSGTYDAGAEVSAYVVLFDNSDATKADNYAVTTTLAKQVPSSGALTMAWSFASDTSGWTSTAVPEPTSGLLMLLGMASLALKRKRA